MDISLGSPEESDVVGFIYNPADSNADQLFIDANILYDFIQIPMTESMDLTHIKSDEHSLSYMSFHRSSAYANRHASCQSCKQSDPESRVSFTESTIQEYMDKSKIIICLPCARKLQYELYLKSEEYSEKLTVGLL